MSLENSHSELSQSERLYTVQQAAETLNLPVTWLYERTRKKAIPCHRYGKYIRFTDSDLREIIASGVEL